MSFFKRLFSKTERKNREPLAGGNSRICTHEEGEFVHVNVLAPRETHQEEEDADVSSWEMAQVLGRRAAAVVGLRPTTVPSLRVRTVKKSSATRSNAPSNNASSRVANQSEDLDSMQDSLELDMFDDKRNRILKRSHRRRMNFPEKYKI